MDRLDEIESRGEEEPADEELEDEAEAIRAELGELYMMHETGQITQEEFDEREKELNDRLEETELRGETQEPETETTADVATVEHRTPTPETESQKKNTQPLKKRTKAER